MSSISFPLAFWSFAKRPFARLKGTTTKDSPTRYLEGEGDPYRKVIRRVWLRSDERTVWAPLLLRAPVPARGHLMPTSLTGIVTRSAKHRAELIKIETNLLLLERIVQILGPVIQLRERVYPLLILYSIRVSPSSSSKDKYQQCTPFDLRSIVRLLGRGKLYPNQIMSRKATE